MANRSARAAFIAFALILFSVTLVNRACAGSSQYDSGGRFITLPPGSPLPDGAECAARVRAEGWEPRQMNQSANHTMGIRINRIDGAGSATNARFAPRVDGAFTGTTDEIIRWGACKWGLDEDVVRAVAVQESYWRQSTRGDFTNGEYQSYGLLQIKKSVHAGTYPMSMQSTAFNVDYALAWRRACYEGDFTWLKSGYRGGDEWGCVGVWYSGRWYDANALWYISSVRQHLSQRTWTASNF